MAKAFNDLPDTAIQLIAHYVEIFRMRCAPSILLFNGPKPCYGARFSLGKGVEVIYDGDLAYRLQESTSG